MGLSAIGACGTDATTPPTSSGAGGNGGAGANGGAGGTTVPDCTPETVETACGKSTDCQTASCTGGKCELVPTAVGAPCTSDGGELCDGKGKCVPATCIDTFAGSKESDVDCGGDCPACDNGKKCNEASDCKSSFCDSGSTGIGGSGGAGGRGSGNGNGGAGAGGSGGAGASGSGGASASGGAGGDGAAMAGTCAPCAKLSDCPDGQWCNTATGSCEAPQDLGKACNDGSECASGSCVDGLCCDTTCDSLCESCAAADTAGTDGTCAPVTLDTDPAAECKKDDAACIADTCSGVAGACKPAATTTVCRPGSNDSCDPDELCPGMVGAACPSDLFEPSTTVCRTGSGDACDPDEMCTGMANQACPANTVSPSTTVCRTGSGDACDPDEMCSGTANQACPDDVVKPATFECRAPNGACDKAENCTGMATQACPNDAAQPANFECRAKSGECDVGDKCDGATKLCPIDQFAPDNTACTSGVCDTGICATCNDGKANGAETDKDCGGPLCAGCAATKACLVNGDCATKSCVGGVCQHPTSCAELPAGSASGTYLIDPDGGNAANAFTVYCDMTTANGGWTLVARVNGTDAQTLLYDAWTAGNTVGNIADFSLTAGGDVLYPSLTSVIGEELLFYDATAMCGTDHRLLQTDKILMHKSLAQHLANIPPLNVTYFIADPDLGPNVSIAAFLNTGCAHPLFGDTMGYPSAKFPNNKFGVNISMTTHSADAFTRFTTSPTDWDLGIGSKKTPDTAHQPGDMDQLGDAHSGWPNHILTIFVR